MSEKLTTVIPLTTRHKIALMAISDQTRELEAVTDELLDDIGDPQFWITRQVACITGGYPPSEADYVSIQEYVLYLEKENRRLQIAHDHQYAIAGTMLRTAERAKAERDTQRALLREARPYVYAEAEACETQDSINLLARIDATLEESHE